MTRKVVFWLDPNEILIPVDQVPGAIADALYPRSEQVKNDETFSDPNAVLRLKTERAHAKKLREKYPHLPEGYAFSIADLNEYLANLGLEMQVKQRSLPPLQKQRRGAARKPRPDNYYSYQQARAILEKQFAATEGEIAMWIVLGRKEGGINAYLDVYEFADPPNGTLDNLHLVSTSYAPSNPPYLGALMAMFFRRDELTEFSPKNRYITFDALKLKWVNNQYCRSDAEAVAVIKSRIEQSRLSDMVPGYGFSQLHDEGNEAPPDWAMFSQIEVDLIEKEDFSGVSRPEFAAGSLAGWYDETLSAAMWFSLKSVTPREAAMLLCRFNPLDKNCDPLNDSTDETSPENYKLLLRVLEDVAKAASHDRTLIQWLAVTKDKGLKYHSWIDEYQEAVRLTTSTDEETPIKNVASGAPDKKASTHRSITKREILSVEWPMPVEAPSLGNILNELPKWVQSACEKVGRPGKGAEGSHLWNPAQLAVCLAVRTPHKTWACKKTALTNFLRHNFSDHFAEWEVEVEHI